MTQPSRAPRKHAEPRRHRENIKYSERGASAVEYGLLVAGVVAAFLVGAIGLQSVSSALFSQTVTSVEQDETATP